MTDPAEHGTRIAPSGRHFRAVTLRYLRTHLAQARTGELAPDWRDRLAPQAHPADTSTRSADVEILAVAELHETPLAPWEPRQALDWKHALDSWYISSRAALNEERRIAETRWNEDALLLDASLAYDADERAPQLTHRILNADNVDRSLDRCRTTAHSLYVATRDTLGASYRAGLAAGGLETPGRWATWYRARIESWPDATTAARALARLADGTTAAQLETLPTYWQLPLRPEPTIGYSEVDRKDG